MQRSGSVDVVVAGAGIAGLSAALELRARGHSVLVLGGSIFGGHLLNIESITGLDQREATAGYELIPALQERVAEAGADLRAESAILIERADEGWAVNTAERTTVARAIIIATGTRFAGLGVPGEKALRGRGVSDCASCDAPLLRDKVAVVVGGGDSAFQEALVLAPSSKKVVVLHDGAEPTAQPLFREQLGGYANVELRPRTTAVSIEGADRVTGVVQRDLVDGSTETVPADAVFVFVGQVPNSDIAAHLVDVDEAARIQVDDHLGTSQQGIFAAGSVRSGTPSRAASSRHDGTLAAESVSNYLTGTQAGPTGMQAGDEGPTPARKGMVVHDPRGFAPPVAEKELSPRLPGLDGRKIYLVDCLFDNSDTFVAQLQDWFHENHPSAIIELIKPYDSWVDDPVMRARIVEDGDAAVLAVGL